MRIAKAVLLLSAFAFSSWAVNGVAVSVHSTYTHSFGWALGNIERFIIANNTPDAGTVIYSATSGQRARCVSISPRGSRIAFIREDGKVCVKSINPGGTVSVLADIPADSWIDWPTEDYVYYVNRWQGNELWRVNTTGTPAPARVATGLLSAMQFSMDTSLTKGTAVTCCYSARSWSLSGSSISMVTDNGGCGAGISPSGRYFTNNQGDHASVAIRNFNGSQAHFFTAGNCSNAGGNWNRNRWSANSDDWVTFTQGTPYQQENGHHQVLYTKDGSQCIQVQPWRTGVYYEGDDFWVGTLGPTPAEIKLNPSSLQYNANIGASNPSNQSVAVTNGGDGTLPTVTVSETASWLTATVSGSGNTQTITNAVDIAGLAGNVYNATVTVSGSGLSSAQYTVRLTVVAPPVLSTITISPATAYVQPSKTQQFSAAGKDQYGAAFTLGAVSWTVSGGGTISSSGLFTAGATEGGPYTVTATSGTVSGTAALTVALAPPVHIKVNGGGPAVEGWVAGSAYVSNGEDFLFDGTATTTGVTSPAPLAVYQTVRHNDHSYSFPASAVPNGTYTVRIHFIDFHEADRKMNYSIEGESVLTNFNVTEAAGGTGKAVVREFQVQVTDGNGMQIQATKGSGNDVFEAGIEIIGGSSTPTKPPVTVLSPNGGETLRIGDTLTVTWEWDTSITGGVAIWLSVDDGDEWKIITPASIPSHAPNSTRGSFKYKIPATLGTVSAMSTSCRIRVNEYSLTTITDESNAVFTITSAAPVAVDGVTRSATRGVEVVHTGSQVVFRVDGGRHTLELFDLSGASVARYAGNGSATHVADISRLRHGTYLLRLRTAGGMLERQLILAGAR